jgi:lipopolysaccharide export system permease protein
VITAGRAQLRPNGINGAGESGRLAVELHDGTIVREGRSDAPGSVDFDTYVWEPPTDLAAPYGGRGEDAQELTLAELLGAGAAEKARNSDGEQVGAELHMRFVGPLSLPVLALLAMPLALLGSGRTGHAYGLVIGVALLVLYQKLVGVGAEFAETGAVPAWLALWTPYALLLLLTGVLIWHRAEAAGRTLGDWLRRPRRGLPADPAGAPAE